MTGRPRFARVFTELTALAVLAMGCGRDGSQLPGMPPGPMVLVPAGALGEREVGAFWMDVHEVTNDAFATFVDATGYVTEAERLGDAAVFVLDEASGAGAWRLVEGADWRRPEGPGSSIAGRGDHPVVHVSYGDARAYASWAGKRLATEAEWEHAARGGLTDGVYPWGDTLEPDGRILANYWQGVFPIANETRDGFFGTAPVGSFPPNAYGLHDMAGNVWEWTDAEAEGASVAGVRGGSYLCSRAASGQPPCEGYRLDARQSKPVEDANSNVGFRCARSE